MLLWFPQDREEAGMSSLSCFMDRVGESVDVCMAREEMGFLLEEKH